MAYIAYLLNDKTRAQLLKAFPPKYKDVICHHITEKFGVSQDFKFEKKDAQIDVVGYVDDGSLEALVVTVDGVLYRKDGNRYHITLSLDKSLGRKPVESNGVIAKQGFTSIPAIPLGLVGPVILH